jgi:DNA-directed RNA polymerase delta subunit
LIKKSLALSEEIVSKAKQVEKTAKEVIDKNQALFTQDEIVKAIGNVLVGQKNNISKDDIVNYLQVLESVSRNKFGKWGRSEWKEISPKGTRERIYLILKENKQPLHFTNIAELIDKYGLGKKKAHPQTVHNELIKDDRFILVGRGIYALREWGYQKGTIKDVVEEILKKNSRPMKREEIISAVLKVRKVKKATIVINLNNPKFFKRENNLYTILK